MSDLTWRSLRLSPFIVLNTETQDMYSTPGFIIKHHGISLYILLYALRFLPMLYLHYIPDISTFLGVGRIDLRDAAEYGLLKSFIIPIQSIYNHMYFFKSCICKSSQGKSKFLHTIHDVFIISDTPKTTWSRAICLSPRVSPAA